MISFLFFLTVLKTLLLVDMSVTFMNETLFTQTVIEESRVIDSPPCFWWEGEGEEYPSMGPSL